MNPAKWKDYCAQVKRCREQSTLKERIETFQTSTSGNPGADPSLPPELNAVLQAEYEKVSLLSWSLALHPQSMRRKSFQTSSGPMLEEIPPSFAPKI